MKHYKAIVFDFDMTLADSAKIIGDLLNETASHFGYEKKSYDFILPCIGNTHEIMLSHVTGEKDPEKLMEMRDYYRRIIQDEMPRRTTFFPDVKKCLSLIHGKGIKIGLLSQKPGNLLVASLVKYQLNNFFSSIKGGNDVPCPKPDPSGLLAIIDEFKLSVEDVLYIGDSLVDEMTAQNAGVDFAAMLLGGTTREQFNADFATAFFCDFGDLISSIDNLESIPANKNDLIMKTSERAGSGNFKADK
ncbi:MAG: HAD family hydrolase [Spirochaetales bacterium]|nr:HAD family hydrolase [Spirochaetales bacterium]